MTVYELFVVLHEAIIQGHESAPVYYDTEAQKFNCHIVPVDTAHCQDIFEDGNWMFTLHTHDRQSVEE